MIKNSREPINIKELKNIYNLCWDRDTCHPLFKDEWVLHNRAIGQNDITALSIFSIFGGVVLFCSTKKCVNYFWNRLPTGQEIDLVGWPHKLRISELKKSMVASITDLMIFRSGRKDEYFTYSRFVILHRKVFEVLRKNNTLFEGFI